MMILSIFTAAKLKNVGFLLIGLVLGIVIAALFYLSFVIADLKRRRKNVEEKSEVINVKTKKVKRIHQRANVDIASISADIAFAQEQYDNDLASKTLAEKYEGLKCLIRELMISIASAYYPHSPHPLAELSPKEYLTLLKYITERITRLLERPLLRLFADLPLSDYLSIFDLKKKYDEKRLIKLARKAQLSKFAASALTILNYANPVFWIKKLITGVVIPTGVNHIARLIIDFVGDETYQVYSKHLFIEIDQRMDNLAMKDQKALEKMIEEVCDANEC